MSLLHEDAYIDGRWFSGAERFEVLDPATGEAVAAVARCTADDTRRAVAAAERALPAWSTLPARERAAALHRLVEAMAANEDELARLLTREQGKPLAEARGELRYGASFLTFFAEEARRLYGETIPSPRAGSRLLVLRQPIGVGAAITPWNFPSAMIARKLGAALAVGCTLVVKPAEATPLSALALADLAEQAGIPAGVFNVVTGDADDAPTIGRVLCEDPRVRALSFTGSTEVGKLLLRQCAATVKRVSLELGGNAPFLVFDDADVEAAVEGCMTAKFRNAGQTCVAANRILVQRGVYEAFVEQLGARIAALRVGPGFDEGVAIGPLIDEAALLKVEEHVADARARGATVRVGGRRHALGRTFFEPTLLEGVSPEMRMTREETFGPVAGVMPFETEAEALRMANDSRAGLAAYFYARDVGRVWRVSEGLEYGMVGVNTGLVSTAEAPFGGVKESGLGREGSHHGVEEWTELKYVCLGM